MKIPITLNNLKDLLLKNINSHSIEVQDTTIFGKKRINIRSFANFEIKVVEEDTVQIKARGVKKKHKLSDINDIFKELAGYECF